MKKLLLALVILFVFGSSIANPAYNTITQEPTLATSFTLQKKEVNYGTLNVADATTKSLWSCEQGCFSSYKGCVAAGASNCLGKLNACFFYCGALD